MSGLGVNTVSDPITATEVCLVIAGICFVLAPICIAVAEMLKEDLTRPRTRYDVMMKYTMRVDHE